MLSAAYAHAEPRIADSHLDRQSVYDRVSPLVELLQLRAERSRELQSHQYGNGAGDGEAESGRDMVDIDCDDEECAVEAACSCPSEDLGSSCT